MFVTVVTPVILAGYIALGAASAFGGWAFNTLIHLHRRTKALQVRLEELEK